MEFFRNPRFKLPIRLGAIIISIMEIIILRIFYLNYGAVISYGYFITLILMQSFWYFNLTSPKSKIQSSPRFKYSTILMFLLSLLIIISFPAALPKYTYNHGKTLVYQRYNPEATCIVYDNNIRTIEVTSFPKGFPKAIFINNRFYYYEVTTDDTNKYLILNPLTGETVELEKNFFN